MQAGVAVGLDSAITGIGYGIGGLDANGASCRMPVADINALMRELYADAVKQLGEKAVVSAKANHIGRMVGFLRSNPKYPALMAGMRELPAHLVTATARKIAATPGARITPQIARQLRSQYWLALNDWPSSRYMGTIASKPNGRVSLLKTAGRATTWSIPAALGLYNVANALPELHGRYWTHRRCLLKTIAASGHRERLAGQFSFRLTLPIPTTIVRPSLDNNRML